MTNAEIVASFMEERPELPDCYRGRYTTPYKWWVLIPTDGGGMKWVPTVADDLNRLRLVEERLTIEQCRDYDILLSEAVEMQSRIVPEAFTWHASAEQKLAALAEVLRPVVEKGDAE